MWLIIELVIVAVILYVSKAMWEIMFWLIAIAMVVITILAHYGAVVSPV